MAGPEQVQTGKADFDPDELDLSRELDELILGAGAYQNMAPYFTFLAKKFDRPVANLRSRYNYLRHRLDAPAAQVIRRGRPRKEELSPEGDLVKVFAETFRVKPSREALMVLRNCVARYGTVRVAMAMERVRPEGGEVYARAIAAELSGR